MPEERTLPIPAAHREFVVKADGAEVSRENHLLAVNVTKSANRISAARIVYQDGAAATGSFPLSDSGTFVPGAEVEIIAGSMDDPVSLFKGVVIRQSIKVRDSSAPQLVVDCRHKAVRMTVGRKSAYYFDKKDSDIIRELLDAASVDAEVSETPVTHKQQVQFYCTDWDYLLSRAEANGMLVFTEDGNVSVCPPSTDGAEACELLFGASILELDAEVDSRLQYDAVKSFTWDPAKQEVLEGDASDPGIAGPGNLDSSELASVASLDHYRLQHPALTREEAKAWADAQWLRSKMGKVCGRAKCEGIGTVKPGDTVKLGGAGERFNGKAYVTGVRHDFDLVQGWKTHIQFGGAGKLLAEEHDLAAPKASALMPGITGMQTGVVVSNEDPEGEHRVRVRMPLVNASEDGTWARVASPDAGEERGFFFRPEIGDEVVLGFLGDDPRQAVVLGMLHSSAKAAPLQGSDDNHEKVYQSRSKMRLYFNDDKKVAILETPAGNRLTLSEDEEAVTIEDQNGNSIVMDADGIKIESGKAITLKAGTEMRLESGTSLEVKGGSDLKLEGASGSELSSSAITKVKGSMVQIN